MAQRLPVTDTTPVMVQIKALNDRELLDFWEETQQLDGFAYSMMEREVLLAPDYERLIVMELQLRSCMRMRSPGF